MPQVYIRANTFERILEVGHINTTDYNKFIDVAVLEKVEREKQHIDDDVIDAVWPACQSQED